MTPEMIKTFIETGLENSRAVVVGNDGVHFEATVTCPQFAGKTMLAQHRMVYETLGDKLKQEIHALSLKTLVVE